MADFLKNLKVGDIVFVGKTPYKVEGFTPKGYIRVGGSLYNPKNGEERGASGYYSCYLREATKERFEEYYLMRYSSKARVLFDDAIKNKTLTIDQAKGIVDILSSNNEEETKMDEVVTDDT